MKKRNLARKVTARAAGCALAGSVAACSHGGTAPSGGGSDDPAGSAGAQDCLSGRILPGKRGRPAPAPISPIQKFQAGGLTTGEGIGIMTHNKSIV